jgi:hypothetical protein
MPASAGGKTVKNHKKCWGTITSKRKHTSSNIGHTYDFFSEHEDIQSIGIRINSKCNIVSVSLKL